jgi:TonB-dependent SusC/RagA subfamily outer membrane receptor
MKKLQLTLLFGVILSVCAFAQSRTVEGVVTDSKTGEAIVAATVSVKDANRGVATDVNGEYSISVSPGDILVFQSLGYIPKEIVIEDQVLINVELDADIALLDEVVITAYGNQKKKAITGAVSTVSKQAIEARPITSFQTALQGTASGISVSNTTGQPGSGASIQIRGAGSINASTAPLYVVDGVPVVNVNANGTGPSNVLNTINPSDIESISLLKDASASALYGSRAANGVVIINTKRGQRGNVRINFRAQRGFSDLAVDQHETLNAQQYFKVYWQEYFDANVDGGMAADAAAQAANASTISLFTANTSSNVNPFNNDNPFGADGNLTPGTSFFQ